MAKDLTVALRLLADPSGLDAGLRRGESSVHKFTAGVERTFRDLSRHISSVNSQLAGIGMGLSLGAGVRAFAQLDDAMTKLEVAAMDKLSKTNRQFDDVKNKIIDIGNKLPGTTADFAQVGQALLENGTSMGQMLDGALDAASQLKVVMGMTSEESGFMVARMRESFGLAANELPKMADYMQRAKFAYGLKPGEIQEAAVYSGTTTNLLGLHGAEQAKKLLALQGMGAGMGLTGSQFGVDLKDMLDNMSKGVEQLEAAKKGLKKNAMDAINGAGVKLDFFDSSGHFNGLESMVDTLSAAYKKLVAHGGEKEALDVFKQLFKEQGGNAALLLGQKGRAGFDESIRKFEEQASLQQRILRTTQSLNNEWENLTSNIENAMAALTGPAVKKLEPLLNGATAGIGSFSDWMRNNPEQTKNLSYGAAGVAAVGGLLGTLGMGRRLLGSIGGTAVGVAEGKALEKAAGVTPVFVTNWPGGIGGNFAAGLGSSAAGAAGGALLGAGAKSAATSMMDIGMGGGAEIAASAGAGAVATKALWGIPAEIAALKVGLRGILGASVTAVPSMGAGALATGAAGVGLAGAAGYAAGTIAYQAMPDSWADKIGYAVAKIVSPFSRDAKNAIALNENPYLQAKLNKITDDTPLSKKPDKGAFKPGDDGSNRQIEAINNSGRNIEQKLQQFRPDMESAINSSNLADRIGQHFDSAVRAMAEKKAALTIKIDGPGRVTSTAATGFNISVDSGLLPMGQQ